MLEDGAPIGEEEINANIDDMVDCMQKYRIILARAEAGKGKYTDVDFKPNDDSIGEKVV